MTDTNSEAPYTITDLNEEHLRVLADALELYTRIRLGQIEEVIEPWASATRGDRTAQTPEKIETARKLLAEAKMALTGHLPSGSWGIGSEDLPDEARVAHEMSCLVRHRLAWDKQPEGGHGVNFRKPMQWSVQRHPVVARKPKIPKAHEAIVLIREVAAAEFDEYTASEKPHPVTMEQFELMFHRHGRDETHAMRDAIRQLGYEFALDIYCKAWGSLRRGESTLDLGKDGTLRAGGTHSLIPWVWPPPSQDALREGL